MMVWACIKINFQGHNKKVNLDENYVTYVDDDHVDNHDYDDNTDYDHDSNNGICGHISMIYR